MAGADEGVKVSPTTIIVPYYNYFSLLAMAKVEIRATMAYVEAFVWLPIDSY